MQICTMQQENDSQDVQKHNKTIPICDDAGESKKTINILGKYVYCAGGSIARNSGAVNKRLTIQGECVKKQRGKEQNGQKIRRRPGCGIGGAPDRKVTWNNLLYAVDGETIGRARSPDRAGAVRKQKIRAIPHNSKCRYGERGAADAVPQPPERCLSRQAGIVRCCLRSSSTKSRNGRDHSLQVGL